jgi:hypothetical protein
MMTGKLLTTTGAPAMPYIRNEMKKIRNEIRAIEIRLPAEINLIGLRAGRLMAERVRRQTKRSGATGELAAALETCMHFKKYGTNGFQTAMQVNALPKYWAMINYGGFVKPEYVYGNWADNKGLSDPTKRGGVGTSTFKAGGGGSLMTPRKPIKGMHYMSYAYRRVLTEIRSGMFTRKIIKSTR